MKFGTICVHGGYTPEKENLSQAVPIYQTTSYLFKSTEHAVKLFELEEKGFIYSRIDNPTVKVLEKRIAELEDGVDAVATSSGMAAIALVIIALASGKGKHVVSSSSLYGGTRTLLQYTLKELGIETTFVDSSNIENFKKAIRKDTIAIYTETIGNPKNDVADLEALAEIAHGAGVPLVVDNTVTTPYLLKPFHFGADIVVHSTTKFLCGHGTSIGGIIVDSGKFNWTEEKFPQFVLPDPTYHGLSFKEKFGKAAFINWVRARLLRDFGCCMSPFNAFLILLGVETLHLRMPKHCENALEVAKFLREHPKIAWVNYPGLPDHPHHFLAEKYLPKGAGAIIGFGVKGGFEAAKKLIENVKLCSHLANIGDARTLIIHPASTTHQQLSPEERLAAGVSDDFIRLSVGIEEAEDIIQDLAQALDKI